VYFPPLHRGQSNSAVAAMKAATKRALAKHGLHSNAKENQKYGYGTSLDVRRMKRKWGLKPYDGSNVGDRYWTKLREGGFVGKYGLGQIQDHNDKVARERARRERAIREAAHEVGARTALAGVALRCFNERWRYRYSQTRPYSPALFSGGRYYDCSSMVTAIYLLARQHDPNGRGFDGYGYTGTMDDRGTRGSWTDTPKAGDLAFFGPGRSSTTHVAIHISAGEVVSFGSDPVKRLPTRYRSDYVGSKTFL
jgi:cell wall-associated NlpC family hydrolase